MEIGLISHVILFNKKREILIIRRTSEEKVLPNYWDIPGGTVRAGEDPKKAALRELREETGINTNNVDLFFYTSNIDKKKNKQFVRMIFIGKYNGNKIFLNPKDHDSYAWIKFRHKKKLKYKLVKYVSNCIQIMATKKHKIINLAS